ncbi:phosphoglycerate mutase-like protein 2 [Jatropha curcas]|uniref:phosphoglycerate mutase-like protein 2 n=1 Tax=Jatropha curcas TaxID=180498 RepID=UPI001895C4A5|nr:phosphoglycerate mutase-like protein 2 [Jatropha curcas]
MAFPANRVRHAQGDHNVAGEKDHDALLSPEFFYSHSLLWACSRIHTHEQNHFIHNTIQNINNECREKAFGDYSYQVIPSVISMGSADCKDQRN